MYFLRNICILRNICRCESLSEQSFGYYISSRTKVSFRDDQRNQMQKARKTLLIQHAGASPNEVIKYCSKFGQITKAFSYKREERGYYLIEFSSRQAALKVLEATQYFPNNDQILVPSRQLYYQKPIGRRNGKPGAFRSHVQPERMQGLTEHDLRSAKSVNDQIKCIYTRQCMQELDTRLRYFVASNLEEQIQRILPQSYVQLFGSSVNGFGKFNCDLDMMLDHGDIVGKKRERTVGDQTYFLTRIRPENEKDDSRHILAAVGEMVKWLFPQNFNVHKILKARVPIIKFDHSATQLECDICAFNRPGVLMSEVLYEVGEMSGCVRPLVFTLRLWARTHAITHASPGVWLSNFQLTLLVIHFLQNQKILPLLNDVPKSGFQYNWEKAPVSRAEYQLDELLLEFLEYFSFEENIVGRTISINHGLIDRTEEDECAMHLENPIECDLNASVNVIDTELTKFSASCKESYEILRDELTNGRPGYNSDWGLLRIVDVNAYERKKEEVLEDLEESGRNGENDSDIGANEISELEQERLEGINVGNILSMDKEEEVKMS